MKKIIIIIVILAILGLGAFVVISQNPELFQPETVKEEEKDIESKYTIDSLVPENYYIWENNGYKLKDSLETVELNSFKYVPNCKKNIEDSYGSGTVIWYSSHNDNEIPTFYPGDELIYISKSTIPYEGITWARFSDFGYTIGVANLKGDESGHYRIMYDEKKGYSYYIDADSDASQLNELYAGTLFFDKIGGIPVRASQISPINTVLGLEKDEPYLCEWYTGTYFQDFKMSASEHVFGYMEGFTTYNYNFLHSNCISIEIPEWFKSGYYYVNGVGFFRYVSNADSRIYNGQPYDSNIDWNDPIIVRDDDGKVIYNPTENKSDDYVEHYQTTSEQNSESYSENSSTIAEEMLEEQRRQVLEQHPDVFFLSEQPDEYIEESNIEGD